MYPNPLFYNQHNYFLFLFFFHIFRCSYSESPAEILRPPQRCAPHAAAEKKKFCFFLCSHTHRYRWLRERAACACLLCSAVVSASSSIFTAHSAHERKSEGISLFSFLQIPCRTLCPVCEQRIHTLNTHSLHCTQQR